MGTLCVSVFMCIATLCVGVFMCCATLCVGVAPGHFLMCSCAHGHSNVALMCVACRNGSAGPELRTTLHWLVALPDSHCYCTGWCLCPTLTASLSKRVCS